MQLTWRLKKFTELQPAELYSILQLRNEVFVVEQQCVFQDADNKDQPAYHLMCMENDSLLAYSRLIPATVIYVEASIGRVVTSRQARGKGLGKLLMQYSITECYHLFGKTPIKIGAQLYLRHFYESFGFRQSSAIYLEDGIQHIEMILEIVDA